MTTSLRYSYIPSDTLLFISHELLKSTLTSKSWSFFLRLEPKGSWGYHQVWGGKRVPSLIEGNIYPYLFVDSYFRNPYYSKNKDEKDTLRIMKQHFKENVIGVLNEDVGTLLILLLLLLLLSIWSLTLLWLKETGSSKLEHFEVEVCWIQDQVQGHKVT